MSSIRRLAWLAALAVVLCQCATATLVALQSCCAAHRGESHAGGHEAAAETPACPSHEAPPEPKCRIRGVCDGPLAALAASAGHAGILPAATLLPSDNTESLLAIVPSVSPRSLQRRPDSPPPRS